MLEIDALDSSFGVKKWAPLSSDAVELFADIEITEECDLIEIWQDAFERSFFDQVLAGIRQMKNPPEDEPEALFQAFFCIDDREISVRRYLETLAPACRTFGTPGFFGVDCHYQPEHSHSFTKVCPGPLEAPYLIKEYSANRVHKKEIQFSKPSHHLPGGWLISQTFGYWAAFKLMLQIFRPSSTPAAASSLNHTERLASLSIECAEPPVIEHGKQVGYSVPEMVNRVESVLKSTGLVKRYAPLIYIIGHGSSSVNNTHYACYDCGACSSRPGSVNARAFAHMANHPEVRHALKERGLNIPDHSRFVAALHDTSRDEVVFYETDQLSLEQAELHAVNVATFDKALAMNAKERSRRFELIDTKDTPEHILEKVRLRTVSLFEPRPEITHAGNSLCIVGRRALTRNLFFDRRAFFNSYDYRVDTDGRYLRSILGAAVPVCGGINLQYYFSRVDNEKLGAGSKLPHNVVGLIGISNGVEADLRSGLPDQMVEIHDPLRMLMIIEHMPDKVLEIIQSLPAVYAWFTKEWMRLCVIHPETHTCYRFANDGFEEYVPFVEKVDKADNLISLIESNKENFPVYILPGV